MKKVMAVAVAVVLAASAEVRAQGWAYYVPYTTNSSGNSAGQVFGVPGSNLYHAAVKVGGVETRLPEPADATSSFGYCISPDSKWVGGMSQTAAVPAGASGDCTNCGCQGVPAFVPTENPRQGFFRRLFRR